MSNRLRSLSFAVVFVGITIPICGQDSESTSQDIFRKLDANSDSRVGPDEIDESQRRFFKRVLRRGDRDEDGRLTKDEFLAGVKDDDRPATIPGARNPRDRGRREEYAGQLFERVDANKDGRLALEEIPEGLRKRLQPVLEQLGKDEFTREEFMQAIRGLAGRRGGREFFNRLDQNGDGKLTRDELPDALRERLAPVFQRLDKDEITQQELGEAIQRGRRAAQGGGRDLEAMFDRLDANADGTLQPDEVPESARRTVERIRRQLGKLSDEAIAKEQFLSMAGRFGRPGGPEGMQRDGRGSHLPAMFRVLDSDGNGRINKSELADAAEKLASLDTNNDGEIDPRELFARPRREGRKSDVRPNNRRRNRPRRPAIEGDKTPDSDSPRVNTSNRRGGTRPKASGADNAKRFFERFDSDGDKAISKDESPERLKRRFDQLDSDANGSLTANELSRVFERARDRKREP